MGALVSVSLVFIAVVMSQLSNPLLPRKMNNSNNTILIKIMEALPMKDGTFDYLNFEVL